MKQLPILVGAMILLLAGVAWFHFTCDDAWIAFRYASNLVEGRGLVWNPAPFPPVEGYSSFLWVVLCAGLWQLTGLPIDTVATGLLLGASLASLALVFRWVQQQPLSDQLASSRSALLALVLLGIVSNRTFLIWSTSGLEQGFNTGLLLAWLYVGRWWTGSARVWALTSLASALALTRPDGLLTWVLTSALCAAWLVRAELPSRLATVPLVVPLLHLAWRRWMYGLWLPNTYYAKHAAWWPASGFVYVGSFLTEYAWFLWLPLLGFAWQRRTRPGLVGTTASLAVGGQFLYYTFLVGGDHFGYRVYHHLIPLLWLSLPWLLDGLPWRPSRRVGFAVGLLLAAQLLPWLHEVRTHDLEAVRARGGDPHRISPDLPPPLSYWAMAWEEQQAWLRGHFVCIRYRVHANYIQDRQRDFGLERNPLGPEGVPVITESGVGWPGWVLPNVTLIDKLGLNDPVIARNPLRRPRRKMAHDWSPPAGYLECFRPNVTARDGRIHVRARPVPFTEADVTACMERFR